jgi:hypothetical protein
MDSAASTSAAHRAANARPSAAALGYQKANKKTTAKPHAGSESKQIRSAKQPRPVAKAAPDRNSLPNVQAKFFSMMYQLQNRNCLAKSEEVGAWLNQTVSLITRWWIAVFPFRTKSATVATYTYKLHFVVMLCILMDGGLSSGNEQIIKADPRATRFLPADKDLLDVLSVSARSETHARERFREMIRVSNVRVL